jgi:hypothetical protein
MQPASTRAELYQEGTLVLIADDQKLGDLPRSVMAGLLRLHLPQRIRAKLVPPGGGAIGGHGSSKIGPPRSLPTKRLSVLIWCAKWGVAPVGTNGFDREQPPEISSARVSLIPCIFI